MWYFQKLYPWQSTKISKYTIIEVLIIFQGNKKIPLPTEVRTIKTHKYMYIQQAREGKCIKSNSIVQPLHLFPGDIRWWIFYQVCVNWNIICIQVTTATILGSYSLISRIQSVNIDNRWYQNINEFEPML